MTQMTAQVFFVAASAKDALIVPVAALHKSQRRRTAENAQTDSAPAGSGAQSSATPARHHRPTNHPKTALPEGATRYWVSVVAPDGSIEHRRIVVGVSNRVSAEVLSGLKEGEEIVVGNNGGTNGAGAADRERERLRSSMRGFGGLH